MKRKVGLWIDHRKAVIVFLTGEEEEIRTIIGALLGALIASGK